MDAFDQLKSRLVTLMSRIQSAWEWGYNNNNMNMLDGSPPTLDTLYFEAVGFMESAAMLDGQASDREARVVVRLMRACNRKEYRDLPDDSAHGWLLHRVQALRGTGKYDYGNDLGWPAFVTISDLIIPAMVRTEYGGFRGLDRELAAVRGFDLPRVTVQSAGSALPDDVLWILNGDYEKEAKGVFFEVACAIATADASPVHDRDAASRFRGHIWKLLDEGKKPGDFLERAELYEVLGMSTAALATRARYFADRGELVRAAEIYQEAERYCEAGAAYEKAGEIGKAYECHRKAGDEQRCRALGYVEQVLSDSKGMESPVSAPPEEHTASAEKAKWQQLDGQLRLEPKARRIRGLRDVVLKNLIPQIQTKYGQPTDAFEIRPDENPRTSWWATAWVPGTLRVNSTILCETDPKKIAENIAYGWAGYKIEATSPQVILRDITIALALVRRIPQHNQEASAMHAKVVYDPQKQLFCDAELRNHLKRLRSEGAEIDSSFVDHKKTQALADSILSEDERRIELEAVMSRTREKHLRQGVPALQHNFKATKADAERRINAYLDACFARGELNPAIEQMIEHVFKTWYGEPAE